MPKVELSAYELELLKRALPYAQKLKDEEEELTRDGLREFLSCAATSATKIQHYIQENGLVKVVERLQALPERAEVRAVANYAADVPVGTAYSHVIRENIALRKALAKAKFISEADKEQRTIEIRAEIEVLKQIAKEEAHVPTKYERPVVTSGNLFEINISDAHLGKLSWSRETGHESYDVKIADAMYRRAQNTLFDRVKGVSIEKILLVVGNDLINSDTAEGTTTMGTHVSNDGRYHKVFYRARNLIIDSVEQARKIAPVHVLIMPGNHDRLASFHLGDSIEMYFSKYDDVTVDNEPTSRKYFQYGKVMLAFCHGDRGKRDDLPLVMATEQPEMWGSTKYREWHTGHIHQTRTEEQHGVRVRILPSLSPPDAWHADNAYVGNLRIAEGYVWNREEGLITQVFYNDSAHPVIRTKREIE